MLKKETNRLKRHFRIKKKFLSNPDRPRIVVHRTLKHFHVQVMDDVQGKTIYGVSTVSKAFRETAQKTGNVAAAKALATVCAAALKEKKITHIAFDRAGYKFHGCVKAFANELRAQGISF